MLGFRNYCDVYNLLGVVEVMEKFEGFTSEGIIDFYKHIIQLKPVKNYYLHGVWIIKTFRGKPKRKTSKKVFSPSGYYTDIIPYTGAGAAGYDCIVEKVYFHLLYFNINKQKNINKRGLYLRGICSEDNRSGGTRIMFRKGN